MSTKSPTRLSDLAPCTHKVIRYNQNSRSYRCIECGQTMHTPQPLPKPDPNQNQSKMSFKASAQDAPGFYLMDTRYRLPHICQNCKCTYGEHAKFDLLCPSPELQPILIPQPHSMNVIHKYPFEISDHICLFIKDANAQILSLQMQNGVPCLWVLHDLSKPVFDRKFVLYGTGYPLPDNPGVFIGTFQYTALVFHLFETTSVKEQQ
jgi:hypothetical protein